MTLYDVSKLKFIQGTHYIFTIHPHKKRINVYTTCESFMDEKIGCYTFNQLEEIRKDINNNSDFLKLQQGLFEVL